MQEATWLREGLRALPQRQVPVRLAARLSALASREFARNARNAVRGSRIAEWVERYELWADNLMKPLAIPFAGGLASAFVLFSMLAPTFAPPVRTVEDVPTAFYTLASLDSLGPFGMVDDMIILDVTVDEQGRMVEYSSPNDNPVLRNPNLRRIIENNLLFTRFSPANLFGQPVSGKLRIAIRRSHMDVRG